MKRGIGIRNDKVREIDGKNRPPARRQIIIREEKDSGLIRE